ncbi:MAG: nuclear transport factor 2 family protein [Pseudomonadota bacterium]
MDYPKSLDAMFAAWNEHDLDKIRGHLNDALAPSVVFADPNNLTEGIDAFEAMVRAFRTEHPTAVCARSSGFNLHHNRFRYNWQVTVDGKPPLNGMDVTEVDEQGRVVRVDGFFGDVPAAS